MGAFDQKLFVNGTWTTVNVEQVKYIPSNTGETVYRVLQDTSTGKKYFSIYKSDSIQADIAQFIDPAVFTVQEQIYQVSQDMPNIIDIYYMDKNQAITELIKYYPMVITERCNFYGKEQYIKHSRAHYQKFKMPTTERALGEENLKHLKVDPNYENNRQELYEKIICTYEKFHQQTNCFFCDIDPNNILVNDDFTDFKIIDVMCLKYGDSIDIAGDRPFPVPIERIIGPVHCYKYLYSL